MISKVYLTVWFWMAGGNSSLPQETVLTFSVPLGKMVSYFSQEEILWKSPVSRLWPCCKSITESLAHRYGIQPLQGQPEKGLEKGCQL